jgi:hypothetical protein
VEKSENGWINPTKIESPVNSDAHEAFPALAQNGILYFMRLGSPKQLYRSVLQDGAYQTPELLPPVINEGCHFSQVYVHPDERFIIFSANRDGGQGDGDLYVCPRLEDGSWGETVNLGPLVNTEAFERSPHLSADGKILFFVRHPITEA